MGVAMLPKKIGYGNKIVVEKQDEVARRGANTRVSSRCRATVRCLQ